MSYERKSKIYTSFKGAGGPGAPPPQRPGSNPTRMWQAFFVGCIVAFIVSQIFALIVFPGATYIQVLISCLCAGFAVAVSDWITEVIANKKGLWFMYGGHTRIGRINTYTIPLEMSLGFIFLAGGGAILSYLPSLLRVWGTTLWPFVDPNLDLITYVPVLIIIIAMTGSLVDFISAKRNGALMNGPNWTYWKHWPSIWVPLMSISIGTMRILMIPWPDFATFGIAVLVVLIVFFSAILLFNQFYIKKHVKK